MRCRTAKRRLTQYLDGELTDRERGAVERHLEACRRCREEADALRHAEDALHRLSAVETAPDLTADLLRRIEGLPGLPAGSRRLAWGGAMVAAMVIVLAAFFWLRQGGPTAPSLHQKAQTLVPPPMAQTREPPPAIAKAPSQPAAPQPLPEPQRRVIRKHTVARERPQEQPSNQPSAEEVEAPAPEPAAAEVEEPSGGVILLVGAPQPALPSSRYYVELSFPNGERSLLEQSVERDAVGEPRTVQVTYQQIGPEPPVPNQGG